MWGKEKLLRLSLVLAIASMILIGVGAFIALGAFAREPYIVNERMLYKITRVSDLNLTFLLEPNEIYEKNAIQPSESLPIYLSLVRLLIVNYTYSLSQGTASGGIMITVLLVHPDGWAKKYYEAPVNIDSRSVSSVFQLNLSSITGLMMGLSRQVTARQDMFIIRIVVSGDTTISYQRYAKKDLLSQALELRVLVGYNKIELSGNQSMQSVFEEKSRSVEVARVMGISIETARSVSLALTSGGAFLMLFSIISIRIAKKPERPEEILESRYSQAIVEVNSPKGYGGIYKNIVYIERPEELIKLSRILEKPILKECYDAKRCEYYIADRDIVYMLKTSKEERKSIGHEHASGRE